VHFDNTTWAGKHILSAQLVMHNWNTLSCAGALIRVSRLTQDWSPATITWTNQPTASTDNDVDFLPAYGIEPTCPNANASWNVTNLVRGWQSGSYPNYGVRVKAVNESNNAAYRSYVSGNYSNAVLRPKIIWTYNSYPGTAADPAVAPAARYATGTAPSTAASYTSSTTPTFSSKATDADGGTVSLAFEARAAASATSTLLASCTTAAPVGQNTIGSCAPGGALTQGSTYYLRAKAFDGTDWPGGSQAAAAGWSKWTKFVVASGVPVTPAISCPGYADGSWTATAPASAVTCTITAAASGPSAPVRIRYSVNGAAEQVVPITQSSDPTQASTTVTIPARDGGYDLRATSESPTGLFSNDAHDRFGYGQLGLAAPVAPSVDPLPVTTSSLAVDASGPPTGGTGLPTTKVQ
jgi:hypothetical protein